MNALKTSVSALALAALAAGGIGAVTLSASPVLAQADQSTSAPPATPAPGADATPGHGWHHGHHRFDPAARARFLDGRIAFFKTVLGITPAQEGAFNTLADAIRANAKDRMTTVEQVRANGEKPKTAIDRLQMRIQFTKMAESHQERLLAAAKPLYDSLSPEQKQIADRLMARAGGGWHHHMHGHRG
jgi:hypothetical protein